MYDVLYHYIVCTISLYTIYGEVLRYWMLAPMAPRAPQACRPEAEPMLKKGHWPAGGRVQCCNVVATSWLDPAPPLSLRAKPQELRHKLKQQIASRTRRSPVRRRLPVFDRHWLHGYLASWVHCPPGKQTFQNCAI